MISLKQIKVLREESSMSIEQLSSKSGVPVKVIEEIEAETERTRFFAWSTICKLIESLGFELEICDNSGVLIID